MAAPAEAPHRNYELEEIQAPQAVAVPELAMDQFTRLKAGRFIGSIALDQEVQLSTELDQEQRIDSLYDATKQAAEGDPMARQFLAINSLTDVIERSLKAGQIGKPIDMKVGSSGEVYQNGQTTEQIQANSWRFVAKSPQMRERILAENNNSFRVRDLNRSNQLNGNTMVTFSTVADNMNEEERHDAGFFEDTWSVSIQGVTSKDEGLEMETAFVAGVKQPGAEKHDIQAIVALAKSLGVDLSGKTSTEILDTPLLIPNELIPNGLIDIVKMYDDHAGGTFFGEDKPQQDYLEYQQECYQREESFDPKVQAIVEGMIAKADIVDNLTDATQLLHNLSEEHMVQYAVENDYINPKVFGPAAPHIVKARYHLDQGNYELSVIETEIAQDKAESFSCIGGGGTRKRRGGGWWGKEEDENDPWAVDEDEDCDFISKKCPMCKAKNVKTKVTKSHIKGSCGCVKKK